METENNYHHTLTGFEKNRVTLGLFLGPIVFLIIALIDTPNTFIQNAAKLLPPNSPYNKILELAYGTKIVSGLLLLMIIWWITEAVPIPVTALLPGIILPLFHVSGIVNGEFFPLNGKNVLLNYAHPIIFLFLSGFLLAAAMQKWGLDRRLTLYILTRGKIANNSRLVLLGMMSTSAFLSMWISNTATTAMLLPLGIGVITHAGGKVGESNFGKAIMLGIAWAASIGGVGTIIGTPPNGICVSILSSSNISQINFLDWMKFGVPYVLLFIPVAWFLLIKIFPPEMKRIKGGKDLLSHQRSELGAWARGEKLTICVFAIVVILWVTNPFWGFVFSKSISASLSWFDESIIALFAALLLFLFPVDWKNRKFVLNWADAKFVDWGTLLLFGGGIALSDAMFKTGLAAWIATSTVAMLGKPSIIFLIFAIVLMIDFLTEVTSNTAVISMMIPILISIASGIGVDPTALCIAATVAASMAFMLPVATPPNALVYGSGYIKITDMVKGGFLLDIIGWLLSVFIIYVFAYRIFGLISL